MLRRSSRGARPAGLALVVAVLAAGPAGARGAESGEAAVLAAVRELDAALVRKDAAALERLLAADFVGAVPTGESFRRDAYIAYHCRPDEGLASIEPAPGTAPVVRVLDGRFAVVNRRVAVERSAPGGRRQAFTVQRLEALALSGGRWTVIAGQGTAVGPLPPR